MATTPRHEPEPLPDSTGSGRVEPAYAEPTYAESRYPESSDSAAGPVDDTPARRPIGKSPEGINHTRAAATYTGLVIGAIILVVLLIFIVQNLDKAPLHLFVWTFDLPLGVSILLAAILGALIMGFAGGVRILQIRRAAKRK